MRMDQDGVLIEMVQCGSVAENGGFIYDNNVKLNHIVSQWHQKRSTYKIKIG